MWTIKNNKKVWVDKARLCQFCGKSIAHKKNPRAKYCNSHCQYKAHRARVAALIADPDEVLELRGFELV